MLQFSESQLTLRWRLTYYRPHFSAGSGPFPIGFEILRMRRRLMLLVAAVVVVAIGAGLALAAAWRHVPGFYVQALAIDAIALNLASDELLEHAAALSSDTHRRGKWQALFSSKQINGWLAVDMPHNHPDLLPANFHDPRVAIEDDQIYLACRWGSNMFGSVLSLKLGVQMTGRHTLAIRVEKARAGLLPVPIDKVLETISREAARAGAPVQWRTTQGDPVAIVRLPPFQQRDTLFVIHSIALRDQQLFVAGHTELAADIPLAGNAKQTPGPVEVGQRPTAETVRK